MKDNKDTDIMTLNPTILIKNTLVKFTELYAAIKCQHDKQKQLELVAKKINSGDCGMAAIAVHHVLKEKYMVHTDIMICRNHCWLHYDGKDYDTLETEGYKGRAADKWEGEGSDEFLLEFKQACDEWMPCDVQGAVMVKAFCTLNWVNFPPELQHCLDNADEYERPGELEKLEAHAQSVLETF